MAKYFFHIVNGDFVPDTQGTECDGADDVKARAVVAAGEMLSEQGLKLWETGRWYERRAPDLGLTVVEWGLLDAVGWDRLRRAAIEGRRAKPSNITLQ